MTKKNKDQLYFSFSGYWDKVNFYLSEMVSQKARPLISTERTKPSNKEKKCTYSFSMRRRQNATSTCWPNNLEYQILQDKIR